MAIILDWIIGWFQKPNNDEDLFRIHPDNKTKLVFDLKDATETDGEQLQRLLLDWLETFRRKHDVETVDTSFFWSEFYKFFMSQVMINHDDLNISVTKKDINHSFRAKTRYFDTKHLIRKIVSKIDSSADKEATLNHELDDTSRNTGMVCIRDSTNPFIMYTEPAEVAKIANEFLISKMNAKVVTDNIVTWFVGAGKSFVLTKAMVEEAIGNLNSVAASGMLVMTTEMLKLTKTASALILFHIFKRSIDEGQVPDDWRHTLIKLMHKDGARDQIANYRPIGITCVPSKILESIIADHLNKVVSKKLNPRQYGNRKKFSSMSQIFCLHEELLLKTKLHGRVDCVRIDFTKAADMVVHSVLVNKLWSLNIDPKLIRWIEAYLTDRLQSVKICNAVSEPKNVTSGLPQGSPLSNVLLNIYLNDLYKIVDSHTDCQQDTDLIVYQYSDDTIFAKPITCEDDCEQLQNSLHAVEQWMEDHYMLISAEKCNSMTFSSGENACVSGFTYSLTGKRIKKVVSMKYLGIMICDDFSWEKQFLHAMDNVKIDFYVELCHALNAHPGVKMSCYEQYVRSRLENNCAVWNLPLSFDNFENIRKMESIQSEIFPPHQHENGLESLAERRLMYTLGTLSKIFNRDMPFRKIVKLLDVLDQNFDRSKFEILMNDSIIGNAVRELVRLNLHVNKNDSCVVGLMKNFNHKNSTLRGFCREIINDFTNLKLDESYKMSHKTLERALLIVNMCLHPKYSVRKLELKIGTSDDGSWNSVDETLDDDSTEFIECPSPKSFNVCTAIATFFRGLLAILLSVKLSVESVFQSNLQQSGVSGYEFFKNSIHDKAKAFLSRSKRLWRASKWGAFGGRVEEEFSFDPPCWGNQNDFYLNPVQSVPPNNILLDRLPSTSTYVPTTSAFETGRAHWPLSKNEETLPKRWQPFTHPALNRGAVQRPNAHVWFASENRVTMPNIWTAPALNRHANHNTDVQQVTRREASRQETANRNWRPAPVPHRMNSTSSTLNFLFNFFAPQLICHFFNNKVLFGILLLVLAFRMVLRFIQNRVTRRAQTGHNNRFR